MIYNLFSKQLDLCENVKQLLAWDNDSLSVIVKVGFIRGSALDLWLHEG